MHIKSERIFSWTKNVMYTAQPNEAICCEPCYSTSDFTSLKGPAVCPYMSHFCLIPKLPYKTYHAFWEEKSLALYWSGRLCKREHSSMVFYGTGNHHVYWMCTLHGHNSWPCYYAAKVRLTCPNGKRWHPLSVGKSTLVKQWSLNILRLYVLN